MKNQLIKEYLISKRDNYFSKFNDASDNHPFLTELFEKLKHYDFNSYKSKLKMKSIPI